MENFYVVGPAPPYHDDAPTIKLKPILPAFNERYSKPSNGPSISEKMNLIPARTRPRSLSEGLLPHHISTDHTEHLHPEGDTYSFFPDKRVVTSADLRDEFNAETIRQAHALIMESLDHNTNLSDVEMYLNIRPAENSVTVVEYYLVDYQLRIVFWIEDILPSDFNTPQIHSPGFLKSFLSPEFWTHVEYFCMHRRLNSGAEEELVNILAHGRIDGLTSPGSTFPYSEEECAKFLDSLQRFHLFDSTRSVIPGYRTAAVARIFSAICRARHINNFGLANPRLDRLQGLEVTILSPHFLLGFWDLVSFSSSKSTLDRMMTLFNGRVVYQRHWSAFFVDIRNDWNRMVLFSSIVLIVDAVLLSKSISSMTSVASACLAGASLVVTQLLHLNHPEHLLTTGPDFSAYLVKYESYYTGLRPLAALLTLPQVLTTYSGVLMNFAILSHAMKDIDSRNEQFGIVVAFVMSVIPVLFVRSFFADAAAQTSRGFWSGLLGGNKN